MKHWVALFSLLSSSVLAAPYASQIRVSSTDINVDAGLSISYVLNQNADATTISLVRGETLIASFAGSTARGENSVLWNGRVDNAAGAVAPSGSYQVRIEASAKNDEWLEVSSHRSLVNKGPAGTVYNRLFNGASLTGLVHIQDSDSDFFGSIVALGTDNAPVYAGGILLDSDLDTAQEDSGLSTRILRALEIEAMKLGISNSNMYGACVDPDNRDAFFVVGQRTEPGLRLFYGDLDSSETLRAVDPENYLAGDGPRAIVVTKEGEQKFAYTTRKNYISKFPVDPVSNQLSGPGVVISAFNTSSFSRGLEMDRDGNLYWICRDTNTQTGGGGCLYRWDAATVVGANTATPLTEANADWKVEGFASTNYMVGPAISPRGEVYVGFATGGLPGVYRVGNTSQTINLKTLASADRVVNFKTMGTPPSNWILSQAFGDLKCDFAGNIIVYEQSTEQMRMFSPPGEHHSEVIAPPSQTFVIGASVGDWAAY